AVEERMEGAGAALAGSRKHQADPVAVGRKVHLAAEDGLRLGEEQERAVRHVTEGWDLTLVVGYAGTGKSAMLGVARKVWEAQGYQVRGAALSGIAAEGLEAGSGIKSRTLASLEWGWKEGREADRLTSRDVLVVDEAGMVGSRQMERVLAQAREAGAKVVLVGDPEQLQAIEAGAAFRALAERHGAAEIAEVRRQRVEWQRDATRELATGRTGTALDRYAAAGMVVGHATQDEARAAVVAGWARERQESPSESRIMLAHTRADVAALNALARERLREAGELGPERVVATERGERAMAAGDRVMFLRNERALGAGPGGLGGVAVKNGTLGTVLVVEAGGERLTVALDGAGGPAGKRDVVTFYLRDYGHLDHGYAATVHKAQGVTVDRAHVLAGTGMDRHMAYVALTRHREGVSLHWAAEAVGSREGLARTLSRERAKDTILDYGAAFAERRGLHPLAPRSEIVVRRSGGPARPRRRAAELGAEARASAAEARREFGAAAAEIAPAPLLPVHRDPQGRDSLGRGTTPADLAAAADVHPWILRHAADRQGWLYGAYREPDEAGRRLSGLIRREGSDLARAAAVLAGEGPEMLGALRGRNGWFAGQAAKDERVRAVSAAQAIGRSLRQEAKDRERAMREHAALVEGQRKRDAVEVPGLSRAAWEAVRAVEAAPREGSGAPGSAGEESWQRLARERAAVAEVWAREVVAKPSVTAELRVFAEAAGRRLGSDVEGVLRRAEAERGAPEEERPREGLAGVARALSTERAGRSAYEDRQRAVERQREAEQERLGLRQGRGMRM
ncbi:AAA family ATPase, partial [Roseicella sp. DB1501]|uniref:AAA family ATPase n=1 Tax=Roseicella sp. DB1501 TaxID=2730925 RepID=UPI0020C2B9EA